MRPGSRWLLSSGSSPFSAMRVAGKWTISSQDLRRLDFWSSVHLPMTAASGCSHPRPSYAFITPSGRNAPYPACDAISVHDYSPVMSRDREFHALHCSTSLPFSAVSARLMMTLPDTLLFFNTQPDH